MFWRKSAATTESATSTTSPAGDAAANGASSGKGRPTPTRREAEAKRKAVMRPPKTRKEAAKIQREKAKVERVKSREALVTGEDRYLPARDRGPLRKYARDLVDSRRSLGEFFLLAGVVIVALLFTGNPNLANYASAAWLALMLVLIFEAVLLGRRVVKAVDTKFPPDKGPYDGRRGIAFYAVMRNFQLRRMRLPKPNVKPGQAV